MKKTIARKKTAAKKSTARAAKKSDAPIPYRPTEPRPAFEWMHLRMVNIPELGITAARAYGLWYARGERGPNAPPARELRSVGRTLHERDGFAIVIAEIDVDGRIGGGDVYGSLDGETRQIGCVVDGWFVDHVAWASAEMLTGDCLTIGDDDDAAAMGCTRSTWKEPAETPAETKGAA